jgi:hypothetical protein
VSDFVVSIIRAHVEFRRACLYSYAWLGISEVDKSDQSNLGYCPLVGLKQEVFEIEIGYDSWNTWKRRRAETKMSVRSVDVCDASDPPPPPFFDLAFQLTSIVAPFVLR